MGEYDSEEYSQYEDEEQGSNQEHYVQRRKKNPFDLAGAASGDGDCCAHVVSPYVFLATLVGLAIATYFLRQAITMNLGRKRRKRSFVSSSLSRTLALVYTGKSLSPTLL
jgi:hypothetical protein